MSVLCELHSHLYACLEIGDLPWLAERKKPRWKIFKKSYEDLYKKKIKLAKLFEKTKESQKLLSSYYHFTKESTVADKGFAGFQTCFDFLISLCHLDEEEIKGVCLRVAQKEKADYAEYRIMFPAYLSNEEFCKKIIAFCEGLSFAEKKIASSKILRAVISLSREDKKTWEQYKNIQRLLHVEKNQFVQKHLVAIDFCYREEGYPPIRKKEFFTNILTDNQKKPNKALAILYHVGESYTDKSVESAVRWIVEAAQFGVHRLGHAIALGISPEFYLGQEKKERIDEYQSQLIFEKKHAISLKKIGYKITFEKENISKKNKAGYVYHYYDSNRVKQLRLFQNWAMKEIKNTKAVIECCPTSNLLMGNINSPSDHPLVRFIENGLAVVIGTDDPGILQTNLEKEYEQISQWPKMTQCHIEKLKNTALYSTSPILSGRNMDVIKK